MNNNPKGAKNPKKPLIFYYAVMLLVLMMLNWLLFPSLLQRQVTEVGYDEFISMVDKGQVETIAYDKQNQEITFEAKNDKGKDALYKTGIFPDDELVGRLLGANVKFAAEIPTQTSPLLSMLISYVVPIVLIIAVGQWLQKKMMKNMGGNMMSFGKSNAKIYAETETGKTFADVAGQDEAKEALTEIVDFLHNPGKYASIGAKLPKGALLVGPPGTGKTLRKPLPAKRNCRSSPSPARSSSKCSSAWARPRCAICSSRPAKKHRASCSSTRLIPSVKSATAQAWAATMSASRRSTNC